MIHLTSLEALPTANCHSTGRRSSHENIYQLIVRPAVSVGMRCLALFSVMLVQY